MTTNQMTADEKAEEKAEYDNEIDFEYLRGGAGLATENEVAEMREAKNDYGYTGI